MSELTKNQTAALEKAQEAGLAIDLSAIAHRDYSVPVAKDDLLADVAAVRGVGELFSSFIARVTHGAIVSGLLGGDGDNVVWKEQKDYAKAIDVAPGTVTKYKRLGRAYVVHGVHPEESAAMRALWGRLYQNVNSSPLTVKAIMGEEAVTPAELSALMDKDAEQKAEKDRLKAAGGTGSAPVVEIVLEDGTVVQGKARETLKPPKESVTDLFGTLNDWCMFPDSLPEILAKAKALAEKAGEILAKADAEKAEAEAS